ncbi:hypothetical protein BDQ17DRAFT_1353608 [Cyathus striatus]|nr:hypothetical protein BDQ17DRAFT_1353608 [Cyathus striatus]
MNFDACPHHNHPNFLSQEGIFCRLCNAFRQLAALSQHSMLAMAIEKLSSWTIRSPNSATNAILLLLVDRGHLWKSVDFLFWNTQPALTNIPAGSLSVLEHASLDIITGPATYNDNAWTILHSSPRLSSVTWNNLFTPFAHAPWEQLKIIECLISLPLDGLLDSLHSCRNLEVLIMKSGVSDANLPQLITRSITLPALKQLQLHHLRDGFSTLFNAISAPNLPWLSFIRRSKCMLSSFRLGSDSMTATESLEWLETPGLSNASDVQMFIKPDIKLYDPHIKIDPNQTYVEAIVAKAKKFVSQYESCSV